MPPEAGGSIAVAEPEPETPFDTPEAPQSPRTPPAKSEAPLKKPTFYDKVKRIPKEDWGTRAYIYVYCWEPICNLKMGGENKYLVRLGQPLYDEQLLMVDYGSGKYHLKLVYRKPGGNDGDTVDTTEVEVYNPKYPPKIPRSVWMNDPRNEKWAALLPKEEPPVQPTGLGTVTDAFETFTKIRKDMREEITPAALPPPPPPVDPVAQFRSMLQTAKEMMPPPQAPATDNKVLDTVVQLMMKQLDASQSETKELRAEMREMMRTNKADHGDSSFEGMIDKFEKIAPKLQGILGLGGEKLTDVVHGRKRDWWQELLINAAPQAMPGLNALMGAAANYFMAPKGPGLGAPPANGQQQTLPAPANGTGQQQPTATADPLQPLRTKVGGFLQANLKPMQKYFESYVKGELSDPDDPESKIDGEDFAIWVDDAFGSESLTDARSLGSANIVAMFQVSPYWAAIAPVEAKFREFLDQALRYTPMAQDQPEGAEGKPVDLTD